MHIPATLTFDLIKGQVCIETTICSGFFCACVSREAGSLGDGLTHQRKSINFTRRVQKCGWTDAKEAAGSTQKNLVRAQGLLSDALSIVPKPVSI